MTILSRDVAVTGEALFNRMGFESLQHSPGVHRVVTPMSFPDGEPIKFYLEEKGGTVRISDNADTLMHLRSVGMDLSDRKRWIGLRHIISRFGMTLQASGEVTSVTQNGRTHDLVSRYIGAMMALADYQRDAMGNVPDISGYIEEVVALLRKTEPAESFIRSALIPGHSGQVHKFHFKIGNEYIDAAKPQADSTGIILRKAADIQNCGAVIPLLVVMDDREEVELARSESVILSSIVTVLPFSTLAASSSGRRKVVGKDR